MIQEKACSVKKKEVSEMLKRINDVLAGLPMTIIGGVLLVFSFVLPRVDVSLPVDPAWGTVVISGIPLLYLAVWRIIYNPGISKISSALLITIAMFAAIAIGDLFAAGEVAFIMAIGALLEDATTNRAKKGLKKLISLAPTQGRRIRNGKEEMISAEKIMKGDMLRILPGETVPVDGVIVSGETSVDQSIMTGESLPVDKAVGDTVFCGTINRFGAIDIRATRVGEDSSLQKLIRMVQEAEDKKAPMARIADRVASWLVPIAMLVAVIAGIATQDIVRAVTVLVVFCPCALVLATPTAIMAAIGQATKHGVIIKSGEALEKMGKVDTIAFDKTGTLTYGKLEVSDVLSFSPELSKDKLLYLAASAEAKSEHPLGKAIVAYAKKRALPLSESAAFQMTSGKGISAEVDGYQLLCGNEKYLHECGVSVTANADAALEKLRLQGKASILVAVNGQCVGVIALSDVLRPEAAAMVQKLTAMQTNTVLLSEQLVLPCNHIFCGDLVDFSLAEIREQFCFDDILLGLPCAFFQPRLEIVGVDFAERLKAHIQITGALLLKLLLPFQCFPPRGESTLAFGLAFSCPVRVLCHHIPRTVFLVLISWHLHPSFLFRRTVH